MCKKIIKCGPLVMVPLHVFSENIEKWTKADERSRTTQRRFRRRPSGTDDRTLRACPIGFVALLILLVFVWFLACFQRYRSLRATIAFYLHVCLFLPETIFFVKVLRGWLGCQWSPTRFCEVQPPTCMCNRFSARGPGQNLKISHEYPGLGQPWASAVS